MIYLDNAATSGVKPQGVVNAVKYALENYSANPGRSGHTLSVKTAEKVYETREKLSRFFNSDGAETVIFTQNIRCSHTQNQSCVGLDFLLKILHSLFIIAQRYRCHAVRNPRFNKWSYYCIMFQR